MKKPLIVVNLKTYKNGKDVLKLAKLIEKFDNKIIIGVQATDVFYISRNVKNPVYIQHVDYQELGRNTGFILPEAVKSAGAKGVFLNHSEHKLDFEILKKTVNRCKKIKLKVLVFASSLQEAVKIKQLKPDYLVFEPPELVAGDVSVSSARPDLISEISKKLKYDFLVGAGIKNYQDLKIAMNLGASGIALSSGITKAKNPEKVLKDLIKGN